MSWQLGLKACALYRDGSKLSQPLSNKSDKKKKNEDDATATSEQPVAEQMPESNIVDMSKLTIQELLDEVQKTCTGFSRYQTETSAGPHRRSTGPCRLNAEDIRRKQK